MLIHSAVITGSVQLNNTDVSSITNVAGFATTSSVDSLVVKTGSYASTSSVNELQSKTGSYATTSSVNNLQSVTGSYATTSSFGAYTSSNDSTNTTQNTRLSTIESVTGSYATTSSVNNLQSVTGSYATTGSNQFNGNQSISGSITSNGTITAQTLVVQTVTSSVEFVTGSTRNGSLLANTHQFTGSLFQTGSTAVFMGNVGIGTTSPDAPLDVVRGSTGTVATFGIEGLTTNPRLRIDVDETNNTVTLNPNYSGATSPSLVFKTQEAERMRITSTGNVGIGTSSPNLNNFGTALTISASSGYAGVEVYGSGSNNGGQIDFGSGNIRYASVSGEFESSTNGFLNIRTRRAGTMENAVRITSAGNVGIGMSNPTTKLAVLGTSVSAGVDGIIYGNTASGHSNYAVLGVTGNAFSYGGISANTTIVTNASSSKMAIGTLDAQPLQFVTDYSERMRILSGGAVLINRTTQNNPSGTSLLEIGGSQSSNGLVRIVNAVNQGDVNHGSLIITNTANYAIGNDASIGFALNRADNSYTDPRASIGCKTESSFGGALVFNTRLDSGTFTERMRITSAGQITLSNSPGIRFVSGSSNLNYYTTSTWTPQFAAGGTTSFGLSSQTGTGRYTRIGNVVTIHGQITWNGAGSSGTNLNINNLPFRVAGDVRGGIGMGLVSGIGDIYPGGLQLVPELNSFVMYLITHNNDGSAHIHLTGGAVKNNGSKIFSFAGSYITDE